MEGGGETPFPPTSWELERVEPVYETLPGGGGPPTGIRTLSGLPRNARAYLERIEELVATPIAWCRWGPAAAK